MNSKDNATKNKKRRNPFRYFFYDFVKITGAPTAYLWLRPKRIFESKKAKKHIRGGAVAIANHTNVRDPIALYFAFWYRRIHMLAMQEMFTTKWGNWFFRQVQCIPVDRSNFKMETFRTAVEVLREGGVIGIFPEGKIGGDKTKLEPFKSGAVLMALTGRVPIVPVYIVIPKKWYERVVVVIGEQIDPQEICGGTPNLRTIDEVSQKLREKELELMEIYNSWKAKKSSK